MDDKKGALQLAFELLSTPGYDEFHRRAYLCPARKPTIGYGSTHINGKPVVLGQTIEEPVARNQCFLDLLSLSKQILSLVHVPLNRFNMAALLDFCYNEGIGNFSKSTLLKKINAHDFAGASLEFKRWKYAEVDGHMVVLDGLVKRREAERKLFCS